MELDAARKGDVKGTLLTVSYHEASLLAKADQVVNGPMKIAEERVLLQMYLIIGLVLR